MKVFLLEGKYTHYVCIAEDLTEVQKQLENRYKWGKDTKVSLNLVNSKLIFTITWLQYNHNAYQDLPQKAEFILRLSSNVPTSSELLPESSEGYY